MTALQDPTLLREQCLIDGEWVGAAEYIEVRNPATGELVGRAPKLGVAETKRAIEAANRAWPAWRAKTPKERGAILRKWFTLIMQNQEDLAQIMTAEQGKPLAESRGEIGFSAGFFEWFADEARRVYGDVIPSNMGGQRLVVMKEPVGVCAAITPWNFPSGMIARKLAPALAVGCTMVVKPAEQTPLSAFALAVLGERAGVPAGVMSVITGDPAPIGQEMCANPLVRKITFTGSTEVGRLLLAQSAPTIKKISMELGGNAPFIVFDDADLDAAVEGAMISKYRNTGQTCVCANRILVQSGVYEEFAKKLVAATAGLKVGDGTEDGVRQGPLIDEEAVKKVERHVADAVSKGARLLTGGKRHSRGGTFFEPTILADVNTSMLVTTEETFGPVAPLFRFDTEDEAIAMANNTEFGLASYFYSRDIGRVWRIAERLESGMVGINNGLVSTEVAPFGGVKQSGLGREGSKYGVDDYLVVKLLCMAGI